ncbi:GSCOCG00006762001-RA-CDS, partial [Cotesia congregata]
ASEKASRATPPGLAPERQSGRRALIIAQLGDAERSKRSFKLRTCQFSPPVCRDFRAESLEEQRTEKRKVVGRCRGREEEPGLSQCWRCCPPAFTPTEVALGESPLSLAPTGGVGVNPGGGVNPSAAQ